MGIGGIQSKKWTMQCLNDHLASCLERMRIPEVDNWRLESKIQEHLVRDYLGCVGLDLCNLCGHCPHFSAD